MVDNTSESYVSSVDMAYVKTLSDVINSGEEKSSPKGNFYELGDYSFTLLDPRQRLLWNPNWNIFSAQHPYRLIVAVARFVFMMGGNDRAEDFAYYDPQSSNFSDDGYVIPGTAYGKRIFNVLSGVDQLDGVIKAIKKDPNTRRACIDIFHFLDAVRISNDIPCTFGLNFRVSHGELCSSILMRSNNAFGLMPFNIFEFSLLSELIAIEVGLPLGALHWMAWSMHIYGRNLADAQNAIVSYADGTAMPKMPNQDNPLKQISLLIALEGKAREYAASFPFKTGVFDDLIQQAKNELDPYWTDFLFLLLIHMVRKHEYRYGLSVLKEHFEESFWKQYLHPGIFDLQNELQDVSVSAEQLTLFPENTVRKGALGQTNNGFPPRLLDRFERVMQECDHRLLAKGDLPITQREFLILRSQYVPVGIEAARDPFDSSSIHQEIIKQIRQLRNQSR